MLTSFNAPRLHALSPRMERHESHAKAPRRITSEAQERRRQRIVLWESLEASPWEGNVFLRGLIEPQRHRGTEIFFEVAFFGGESLEASPGGLNVI